MNSKKKPNKYVYLKVLQGCYDGQTWDDLVYADENDPKEMADFRQNCKDYRENEDYPHRVIRRREANPKYMAA